MDSYLLNVYGREKGPLQQERTASSNRPILSIRNSYLKAGIVQNVGFVRITSDVTGSLLAAGDALGKIFIFDLYDKKFHFVCRLDNPCSAFAFFSYRDLIAATTDCAISFIDFVSCTVRKSVPAHRTYVNHISVNTDKSKAVTSSVEDAVVWDLPTLTLMRRLAIKKYVDILKVIFLPVSDHLLSAFRDNSLFLWNTSLKCIGDFSCSVISSTPWLRTVDCSRDGTLIACGGKVNWVSIWRVQSCSLSHNVSFSDYLRSVKQTLFLSVQISKDKNYGMIAVLSCSGNLFICDVEQPDDVYTLPINKKIDSFTEDGGILSVLTAEWTVDIFDLAFLFNKKKEAIIKKDVPEIQFLNLSPKPYSEKSRKGNKYGDVKKVQLKSLLYASGEYPEKYRLFIWSQLLNLPRNEEYILLYRRVMNKTLNLFPNQNQTVKKALSRVMLMLYAWCPVLKAIDYIPSMICPFVEAFHKNVQFCFELAVTYINSWCQNWFLYLPFEPFNILCVVENLLLYHDRLLLHHFLLLNIPPLMYGFHLLRTSFSKVFADDQWLALWDNILTEAPSFIIYVVVAFNIASREVLLRCETEKEIKAVYLRNCCLASKVIQTAYNMQETTPPWCDPAPIVGSFNPLPKNGYPIFLRFASTDADFQTLSRHRSIESEIENITSVIGKSDTIKMMELRRLQDMRKDMILQCIDEEHVEHLQALEDKLKRIQELIQGILVE